MENTKRKLQQEAKTGLASLCKFPATCGGQYFGEWPCRLSRCDWQSYRSMAIHHEFLNICLCPVLFPSVLTVWLATLFFLSALLTVVAAAPERSRRCWGCHGQVTAVHRGCTSRAHCIAWHRSLIPELPFPRDAKQRACWCSAAQGGVCRKTWVVKQGVVSPWLHKYLKTHEKTAKQTSTVRNYPYIKYKQNTCTCPFLNVSIMHTKVTEVK